MNTKTKFLAKASMIAALYTALTLISALFGLSSGVIQIRISEALCILPIYSTVAIPGLAVGCFVSNLICGGNVYDLIFGTAATLIGALIAYAIRKFPYLSSIPTILSNAAIIPLVLVLSGFGGFDMFPYFALTVGIGEVISCGVLGTVLIAYLEHHRDLLRYL